MLTVGRALVVAGPSAVGKSTLMRSMQAGSAPLPLPKELADVKSWTYTTLMRACELRDGGRVPDLVLHVDLTQFSRSRNRVPLLRDVLRATQDVYLMTLWTAPGVLRARLEARQRQRAKTLNRPWVARQSPDGTRTKWELVGNPALVFKLYESWFDFTADFAPKGSWMVDSTTPSPVLSEHASAVSTTRPAPLTPPSYASAT